MKFNFNKEKPNNKTYKFTVTLNSQEITFKEVTQLLKESEEFRSELTKQLIEVPFEGFYWEVKPITLNTLNEPFEFVTVNSRRFALITAKKESFVQYFKENKDVICKNLKKYSNLKKK